MDHKLKSEVIFVHPRKLSFFSGIVIARIESDTDYRDLSKGNIYIIELNNKTEIHYIQERFVFTDLNDAKQKIFKSLQG